MLIVQAIESSEYWEYDLEHFGADALRGFLIDEYFHSVPEGIGKRHTQDDEDERQIEKDERDMRFARLGYAFTFDRQHFWDEIGEIPHDLGRSLVQFGLSHRRFGFLQNLF